MQIILNGQTRMLEPGTTVEINEEVVLRSEYAEFVLGEGDRVEIVHAVGGG